MYGSKKWYASKTLWVNMIFLGTYVIRHALGYTLDPEFETALLVLINMVLRAVTKEQLEW